MGLDIYLEDRDYKQRSDAHDKAWETWWAEWGEKPDGPEKLAARAAIPDYEGHADVPSMKHPKHLCNRRYLRSSYSGSGFNRAVPDMIARDHDLYWIFGPVIGDEPDDETKLTESHIEALGRCKDRALQVAQEIRDCDPLRVETATGMVSPGIEHLWPQPPSAAQVLDWYREEQKRHNEADRRSPDTQYMNAKGTVLGFEKGMEVLAITCGRDVLGQPAAVFVYRVSESTKQHYVATAEVVAEFCDEAVELIKRDGECFLIWSG